MIGMDLIGDLDIIKSALLMGDVEDALWKIRSSLKRLARRERTGRCGYCSAYRDLLESIDNYLRGTGSPIVIRNNFHRPELQTFFSEVNTDKLTDTYLFYLEYASDRYAIAYPEFDQKRCDDL